VSWLFATLGIGVASALIPLVNAEAYLGALAATGVGGGQGDAATLWLLSFVAAVGQTIGKVIYYELGRSSLKWAWVRRKTETPKWQDRLTRWRAKVDSNRLGAGALVFAAASLGVPPLAVIAVIAGQLNINRYVFIANVLVGRTLRFAAVLFGVGLLGIGH